MLTLIVALGIGALFLFNVPVPTGTSHGSPSTLVEKSNVAKAATPQVKNTGAGSYCNTLPPSGVLPELLPTICATPTVLCNPGSCTNYPYTSKVQMWVNSTLNSTIYPWVQVVFVVETTGYDGVYDPTVSDYGGSGPGNNPADPCTGPCAESVGVPYFINNVAKIAQGITQKNMGVTDSPHVTFSMVDYFSNYDTKDTSADSHDDGDGSEYNVDVSTFEQATTFATTVTSMATSNPSTLFGGGCPSNGWNYKTYVYCDSDYSDNFLESSQITALYGGLHGSGLGWVNNSTTYHVVVWMGSSMPRDPSYPGDWCVTYNDYASKTCPDATTTTEPTYTYASGIVEPAGETLSSIATIAKEEHVIIDTIDLPDGMTELTPPAPKVTGDTDYIESTSGDITDAKQDITSILSAGCYLATATGGSWEGPAPTSTGIGFTCSAAATGTTDGNLTDTWCAYTAGSKGSGCYPAWSFDPSLGWALTNIAFPPLSRHYNVTAALGEHPFTYIPEPGFSMVTSAMSFYCRHNGTMISAKCQSDPGNGPSGAGYGWDWPFPDMYPGDYWSVAFNVSVSDYFSSWLLNKSIPIDLCWNNTPIWTGCYGTGGPSSGTYVAYTNYTDNFMVQSFPPAFVDVVTSSTSVPTLKTVAVTPSPVYLLPGGTQTFSASPVCTWGTCPTGTMYSWSLTSSLGVLTATTGSSVTFIAKSTVGTLSLFVNGTLFGLTKQSSPTNISIENIVSVGVTPSSAGILVMTSKSFAAYPGCTYGPCPTGATFYWNLTNFSMGNLYSSIGSPVTFTAANLTGTVNLIVNATLGGLTVMSAAVPIIIARSLPILTTVTVTPSVGYVAAGYSIIFNTSLSCTGGTCPNGATYIWNLSTSAFGTINSTTSPTVQFIAGGVASTVNLFVNVSLNAATVESAVPVNILPPGLAAVDVNPPSLTISANFYQNFTTTLRCVGGPCPAGATYVWALTSTNLGSLNTTTGPDVSFSSSYLGGYVSLYVNATLNHITKEGAPVTILVVGVPVLSEVSVSPTSIALNPGGTKSVSAAPICTGGTCPLGTTFSWSLTSSLGTISSNTGSALTFTAVSVGNLALYVNGTLNGETRSATVAISITSPLKSVSVSPTSASINVGGVKDFKVTPTCTSTCPAGVTYSWSVTGTLGTLNSTKSFMVAFTAGDNGGTVNLFVNASLYGTTARSAAVPITILTVQSITSVSISPTSQSLTYEDSYTFTTAVVCSPAPCSSSVSYSWSMDNPLGTLSSNDSTSTVFTAGNTAGVASLTVTATLNKHSVSTSATITISATPTQPSVSIWSGNTKWILIGAVAAVVAIVIVVLLFRKSKSKEVPPEPESPYGFVMNNQPSPVVARKPPPATPVSKPPAATPVSKPPAPTAVNKQPGGTVVRKIPTSTPVNKTTSATAKPPAPKTPPQK
jgi:hypothetical protein